MIISNASPGMHIHRWELMGDQGSIVLENRSSDYMANFSMTTLDRQGQSRLEAEVKSDSEDGRIAAFASLASRFIASVKAKVLTYPSFADGLRVQLEIDAAMKSNDTRQIVTLSSMPIQV
jgi:predicted dehydrogenase